MQDSSAVMKALREAQPAWAHSSVRDRVRWLRSWRDWLLDHQDRLTDIISAEVGKVGGDAAIEVPVAAEGLNYFTGHAARWLRDERIGISGPLTMHKRLRTVHRPHQLVGVITPWNFPILTPVLDAVPALLAGCAVVLKPSELSPEAAVAVAHGWDAIGAPPVFAVLPGDRVAGEAVVAEADFVQFTGSTATGRSIAESCAKRGIPYELEMGGKDAAIVLADADLERAVPGIVWGSMFNAGQACTSIERVYVERPIYDAFLDRVAREVATLRTVDGPSGPMDVGPLASTAQWSIVRDHVDDAIASGAEVVVGGPSLAARPFYPPTVLAQVDHSMLCMREETFGPTMPVMAVADEDEAVRRANDSKYGLSASVWSSDVRRARQVAERLDVGAVNINDALVNAYAFGVPQGGRKQSGIGARFGGRQGILKYTHTTAITEPRVRFPRREPGWYPYSPARTGASRLLMRVMVARGRRRFDGVLTTVREIRRAS